MEAAAKFKPSTTGHGWQWIPGTFSGGSFSGGLHRRNTGGLERKIDELARQ
jgi:hypothetical protein